MLLQRRKAVRPSPVRALPASETLETRTLFATTVFTIQPELSKVSLAADVVGTSLTRQADGSLIARYEGAIVADVTGSNIRFLGGSDASPETRGKFDPVGTAANYAGEARQFGVPLAVAAVRGMTLDALSAATPFDNNGNFPSS